MNRRQKILEEFQTFQQRHLCQFKKLSGINTSVEMDGMLLIFFNTVFDCIPLESCLICSGSGEN